MHGPMPPYGMIMEYKRLLEGSALPNSLNYQYLAANYFQLHSKCAKPIICLFVLSQRFFFIILLALRFVYDL